MLAAAAFSSLIALRSIKVEDFETDVPVAARIWLADAKHAIRDFVADDLDEEPACIEERLRAEFAAEGIPFECEECVYGDVSVDVTAHENLVAVEVTLGIPYGGDAALYLFRDGRLIFTREENDYERIGEALGAFQWKLSPAGDDGAFLILTTAISTSPAGSWQWLTYTVDRIVPWCDEAIAIDREGSSIYDGWDNLDLHIAPNRYGLRFDTGALEGGFTRTQRLEYEVDGDSHVRIAPIAERPEDFVQEWMSMPEEEAWRWSDVAPVSIISDELYESWGPVRQCIDGWWQVRMDISDAGSDDYEPHYFIVSEEQGVYRVREIRDEPRPGCPDENLPEKEDEDEATPPSP